MEHPGALLGPFHPVRPKEAARINFSSVLIRDKILFTYEIYTINNYSL